MLSGVCIFFPVASADSQKIDDGHKPLSKKKWDICLR